MGEAIVEAIVEDLMEEEEVVVVLATEEPVDLEVVDLIVITQVEVAEEVEEDGKVED